MPSASVKSNQPQPQFNMSDLLQEPLKGAVSVMEKKLRNLEKRKIKLFEYQKKLKQGSDLSDEQKKAAENLILVENSLDTVKELHRLMVAMEQEYAKAAKKEAKRLKQESISQVEARTTEITKNVVQVQAVLGLLSDDVKPAFLVGADGACKLSDDDLSKLDEVYKLVNPMESDDGKKLSDIVESCSSHLISLVEEKDKEIFPGTTYRSISDLLKKVTNSGYFDKGAVTCGQEEQAESFEAKEEAAESHRSPECGSPADTESSGHSFHADAEEQHQGFYQEHRSEHIESAHVVNGLGGVDLPPDLEDQAGEYDDGIDFMGESEIGAAVRAADLESGSLDDQPALALNLNAGSPEFIPRSMQPIPDTAAFLVVENSDDAHPVSDQLDNWNEQAATESEWQSVAGHQNQHQSGGFRGRGRGPCGASFNRGGGRGRGGRGGGYHERGNREGGDNRGGRDNGDYRGGKEGGDYRGGRDGGDYRGGREGGDHRGNRQDAGGFQRARGDGFRGGRGGRGGGERNFRGGNRGSYRGGGGLSRPQQPQ